MFLTYRSLAAASLLIVTAISTAMADTDRALQQQLDDLRAKLEQQDQRLAEQDAELASLRRDAEADWMTERRAEQIKALVSEVLSDAETRAALLDDGILYAGCENGKFFLSSEDGNFYMNVLGMVQFRYIWSSSGDANNEAKDDPATPAVDEGELDDSRAGFEMRRARFGFKGHVVDPSWQYFLLFQVSRSDGDAVLLDAWMRKVLNDEWKLVAGQFKVPIWREWTVSGTRQPFVERSLITAEFAGSYTQGLALQFERGDWRALLTMNDGAGGLNKSWETEDVEGFALSARVDHLFEGEWKQYKDWQAWPGEPFFLAAGAGIHWQQGEYGTSGSTLSTGDDPEVVRWAVDATAEFKGINLFAAFLGNHISEASALMGDLDQYALLVQGGVFVHDDLELVARYEWGDLDVPMVDELSILTVGVNKYFAKHRVKWMTDVGYAFGAINAYKDPAGNTWSWYSDAAGWRADHSSEDGQVVVRSSVQLLF